MNDREDDVVSWLLLERYALGELDAATTARVDAALARDARTRACLDLIRQPLALPDLGARRRPPAAKVRRLDWAWPAAATLAAAALVLLVVRSSPHDGADAPATAAPNTTAKPLHRIKGSAVALSVVREHRGQIIANATSFAEGDRLKVLLTCPPSTQERFRVVVQQGSSVSSPLEIPADFACGNGVALPGAFTLTENTPAQVCVVWGARAGAESTAPTLPAENTVCVPLVPATEEPGNGRQ